jgi:hypothetical protein
MDNLSARSEYDAIASEINWTTNLKKFGGEDAVRDWLTRLGHAIPKGTAKPANDEIAQQLYAALNLAGVLVEDLKRPAFDWDCTPKEAIEKIKALMK